MKGYALSAITKIFDLFSFDKLRKGEQCPCCDRPFKISRKKLNRSNWKYLVELWKRRETNDGWVQISRVRIEAAKMAADGKRYVQTGDYKMLIYFGLAEEHPEERGFVRITQKGIDFMEGKAYVPEAVFVENYRSKIVQFDEESDYVDVQKVAKTPFILAEL